jgi:hypothetical protein
MKLKEVEQTYICQFNKPNNRAMLESYVARKDRSNKELINYYTDVINTLSNTPAWGVSGVNKMINELTDSVRATLTKAKCGKTSAYAHANKILNTINIFGNKQANAQYRGYHKLQPILTVEELEALDMMNN